MTDTIVNIDPPLTRDQEATVRAAFGTLTLVDIAALTGIPLYQVDAVTAGLRRIELPYSEVCLHMRVAGRRMLVGPAGPRMAQLYDDDGKPFSFPITRGEAGYRP